MCTPRGTFKNCFVGHVKIMHALDHPHLPLVHPLIEHLQPGARIHIHGKVHLDDGEQFVVDFLSGPHIVLHVNFRVTQHILVLNACSHGNWGAEVRHDVHLHDHDHFDLQIIVHESHFGIELNGNKIGYFDHRFPYESVEAIGIRGGIHVKRVEFHGFPFQAGWHDPHTHDFGHPGYIGYGTDSYVPPQFPQGHNYGQHWQ
uniref:Galectin n=1 Tax=Panagrolaimus sp. JU765 TaxID=591449 RepID=A0AC34R153_9BILA